MRLRRAIRSVLLAKRRAAPYASPEYAGASLRFVKDDAKPPENCFRDAVLAFAEKYGK